MNSFRHVIIVNKDKDITSREVDSAVKRIYGCKKAGHSGTLDPNATGILIICLDEATKLMPLLVGLDKEYEGIIYLHKDIDLKKLEQGIKKHFVGEIIQTPPVKSRVARKARKRTVYCFDIIKKDGKNIFFRTKVQAGTYIRKLAYDIGQKLNIGAHLKELNRIGVGDIPINQSHTLKEIEEFPQKYLIEIENAFDFAKKVEIKNESIKKILHGLPLLSDDIIYVDSVQKDDHICIKNSGRISALGKIKETGDRMKIKVDRVLNH